ncbi:hypothetical protein HELRODRAFT_168862 [Helobdella robusta]|uniref:Uncharacterized protein n=1 Tax=Helobdella robusta TaxID=6412 RepID=T1F123_HELRO|nr:hypothetical protein HELRODRAFT_168862 [Helobdella robusta]ESO08941.1 hypothetical protein HELRODRAFT_168862 [Helobdella robusta]
MAHLSGLTNFFEEIEACGGGTKSLYFSFQLPDRKESFVDCRLLLDLRECLLEEAAEAWQAASVTVIFTPATTSSSEHSRPESVTANKRALASGSFDNFPLIMLLLGGAVPEKKIEQTNLFMLGERASQDPTNSTQNF